MLVRNRLNEVIYYRKNGECYTINPATVTFFEDGVLTETELKNAFRNDIEIIKNESPFPEISIR